MSVDEVLPDWAGEDDANVPPVGLHVVIVRILRASFDESYRGKPFIHVGCRVIEGEYQGMEFSFDVYFSPKAERMARYFLKKFNYPAELLEQKKTPLRGVELIGLEGKVLLKVEEGDDGFLKFNSMGYAHWPPKDDAGELEKRLARMLGKEESESQDDVPVIQIDEEDPEAALENSQDRVPQATDLFEQGSDSRESRHGETPGRLEVPSKEAEVIPGSTGVPATPLAAQPAGDDPNFLAFLDDLPQCGHGEQALIKCEDGSTLCAICACDGPWMELKS